MTGNTLNYWIGEKVGQRVFTHDYRWINKDALHRPSTSSKTWRQGLYPGAFRAGGATFAPFVAGVSDMTHTRFQFYNIIGATLWVVSLVTGGFPLGYIPIVRDNLTAIVLVGVGAAIVRSPSAACTSSAAGC